MRGKTVVMTVVMVLGMAILAGILNSCEGEKKPDQVMDKEEMTNFLIELYLAEARLSTTIFKPDSADHVFSPYEKQLLQRRGIADSTLRKSYQYYVDHAEEMQQVMDAVIDSLSLREQQSTVPAPAPAQ